MTRKGPVKGCAQLATKGSAQHAPHLIDYQEHLPYGRGLDR